MSRIAIANILHGNKAKPFVQRILNPYAYPVLENEDGSISTHSLSWAEAGGRYYVYPTVVVDKNKAVRLNDDEAWNYSQQTGDFIEFETPEEADWFSKNYKRYWEEVEDGNTRNY